MAHRTPRLLGGNLERALKFYARALQLSPDNSTTLLYFAEAQLSSSATHEPVNVLLAFLRNPTTPIAVGTTSRPRLARNWLQTLDATNK
jgi:hypothetical protein